MTSTRYLLAMIHAMVLFMWGGTAAAATLALSDKAHLSALLTDPLVLTIATAIATAAGITTLAMRVNMLLTQSPDQPLVRPWLFAVAHLGGSYLAAVAALLLASMQKFEADTALFGVLLLSFVGAKALEVMAEKYLAVVRITNGQATQ
jgi:hypothetical protein